MANDDARTNAREIAYVHLWPIALAPLVPAVGLATRRVRDPSVRLGAPVAVAVGILIASHAFAVSATAGTK